jgi:hypothetical protein
MNGNFVDLAFRKIALVIRQRIFCAHFSVSKNLFPLLPPQTHLPETLEMSPTKSTQEISSRQMLVVLQNTHREKMMKIVKTVINTPKKRRKGAYHRCPGETRKRVKVRSKMYCNNKLFIKKKSFFSDL